VEWAMRRRMMFRERLVFGPRCNERVVYPESVRSDTAW
jgi:hypothetical protein